jgi:hypothetical protein
MQCVLGAAMDDALGLHALPAAEAGAFHQHGRKTLAAQARIQPEAGDTSADNQNVGGNNGWHAATSVFKTRAQYTELEKWVVLRLLNVSREDAPVAREPPARQQSIATTRNVRNMHCNVGPLRDPGCAPFAWAFNARQFSKRAG